MSEKAAFQCVYCEHSNISFDFTGLRAHLTQYHKIKEKQNFLFSIMLIQYDEDDRLASLLQSLVDQTKIILKNLNVLDDEIEIIEQKKHETSRKALEKKLLEVLDSDSEDEDIEIVGEEVTIDSDHEDINEEVVDKQNLDSGKDVSIVDSEEALLQENDGEHSVSLDEAVGDGDEISTNTEVMPEPIRGQYSGHMTSVDQSEAEDVTEC